MKSSHIDQDGAKRELVPENEGKTVRLCLFPDLRVMGCRVFLSSFELVAGAFWGGQ